MPVSGALSYAYTKACGIHGKAFTGKRLSRLQTLSRLSDLDRLLFPDAPLDVPERELSSREERRIMERSLDAIMRVFAAWHEVPRTLVLLLQAVEVAELKAVFSARESGDRLCPPHSDLGRFGQVRWDAWPDIKAMLAGTGYEWALDSTVSAYSSLERETAFDQHYYADLWSSIPTSSPSANPSLRRFLAEEIALKNVSWALRLRVYYNYDRTSITPFLVDITDRGRSLAQPALEALELPLDRREAWDDWVYADLVNKESRGKFWALDPARVQNRAALRLAQRARQLFRQRPFTIDALAAWVRLVQFEEDLLTAIAEGLSLGMGVNDILARPEAL